MQSRREFHAKLLGSLVTFGLVETLWSRDLFADAVKPTVQKWLQELVEMTKDLRGRKLTDVEFQAIRALPLPPHFVQLPNSSIARTSRATPSAGPSRSSSALATWSRPSPRWRRPASGPRWSGAGHSPSSPLFVRRRSCPTWCCVASPLTQAGAPRWCACCTPTPERQDAPGVPGRRPVTQKTRWASGRHGGREAVPTSAPPSRQCPRRSRGAPGTGCCHRHRQPAPGAGCPTRPTSPCAAAVTCRCSTTRRWSPA